MIVHIIVHHHHHPPLPDARDCVYFVVSSSEGLINNQLWAHTLLTHLLEIPPVVSSFEPTEKTGSSPPEDRSTERHQTEYARLVARSPPTTTNDYCETETKTIESEHETERRTEPKPIQNPDPKPKSNSIPNQKLKSNPNRFQIRIRNLNRIRF